MSALRKFLVISTYAPPAISGTPLMMYNLLRHFPQDSFVILTSHFYINNRVIEGGEKLKVKYFFFDTPRLTTAPQREESFFQKFKKFIKSSRILKSFFLFLSLFYLPLNIVRRGKKIIKEEKIELLFGYSDHGTALFSTYLLHKITKKPFFLHFYDLYYKNNFPWFYKIVAYFVEPKLFQSAEKIFVMCEGLAEYYKKKYKREIIVIHNSIPIDKSNPPKPPQPHSEPYKIIFTGTIGWPQAEAIKNLIQAVDGIYHPKTQLHLYTPHSNEYLAGQGIFSSEKVIFNFGLPQEMPEIQKSADILFVGLSFKTKHPLLINTSSPGKTYEYLISGRPMLVHAPKESYIAQYVRQHNCAVVVDEDNPKELKKGIFKILEDRNFTQELIANAWKTALLNHDAEKTSKKLQQYFLK